MLAFTRWNIATSTCIKWFTTFWTWPKRRAEHPNAKNNNTNYRECSEHVVQKTFTIKFAGTKCKDRYQWN